LRCPRGQQAAGDPTGDIGAFIPITDNGRLVAVAFGRRIQPPVQCRKDRLPAAA
jgi:hypothetical protein